MLPALNVVIKRYSDPSSSVNTSTNPAWERENLPSSLGVQVWLEQTLSTAVRANRTFMTDNCSTMLQFTSFSYHGWLNKYIRQITFLCNVSTKALRMNFVAVVNSRIVNFISS